MLKFVCVELFTSIKIYIFIQKIKAHLYFLKVLCVFITCVSERVCERVCVSLSVCVFVNLQFITQRL